jgi:hypothetical protein
MVNYENGKIYKIINTENNQIVYIGSTVEQLCRRYAKHHHKSPNHKIILIENYPCNSKEELCKKEQEIIEQYDNLLNQKKAFRSEEQRKEQMKELYKNNKEKVKEQQKAYYENNKDTFREYYNNNKEQKKEKAKEYKKNNKEKIKEQQKEYYKNNKEKFKEYKKAYYQKKKDEKKDEKIIYLK